MAENASPIAYVPTGSPAHEEHKKPDHLKFLFIFGLAQFVLLVLYAVFFDVYDTESGSRINDTPTSYNFFTGIHIMIFLGFGYLMTFLRRSGYSALGFCVFVSAFAFEFALFTMTLMDRLYFADLEHKLFHRMSIHMVDMINADFAAAAVMITMGAMVGRVSCAQLLLISVPEIIMYTINCWICLFLYKIADIGGSITIHTYGAVFGLFCSRAMHKGGKKEYPDNTGAYHNDLFAMLGTLLLWIYWPSFNSAVATTEIGQYRAVVNTVLSLLGTTCSAFYFSKLLRPHHKFDMVDIQNATLAGAVAMGSSADIILSPFVAILVGLAVGLISVLGYTKFTPFLQEKIHLYDTCGILNLHCLPGFVGGLISILVVGVTWTENAGAAAGLQAAGLFTTVGIAAVSGLCTGLFCRMFTPYLPVEYDDSVEWEVPSNFPQPLPHKE